MVMSQRWDQSGQYQAGSLSRITMSSGPAALKDSYELFWPGPGSVGGKAM